MHVGSGMKNFHLTFVAAALAGVVAGGLAPALAEPPDRCTPCAALVVSDLASLAGELAAGPELAAGAPLFVGTRVRLAAGEPSGLAAAVAAGATPWLVAEFETPPPLLDNLEALGRELDALAALARQSPEGTRVQISWPAGSEGGDSTDDPGGGAGADYAFLVKQASAAVLGAQPAARLVSKTIPAEPGAIQRLFAPGGSSGAGAAGAGAEIVGELAAYLDAVALAPPAPLAPLTATSPEKLTAAVTEILAHDPGAEIVLDALALPMPPEKLLVEAARYAHAGVSLVVFDGGSAAAPPIRSAALAGLRTLAREFAGDVSPAPGSEPSGGASAFAFVRGEDLSLRVVIETRAGAGDELELRFSDPRLREPARIDLATGETVTQWGTDRDRDSFTLRLADPGAVEVLALERMSAAELEGILGLVEEVTVADKRQMPVEEIVRRLQAFEDAQRRKLGTYRAVNTSHLRFQGGTANQSVEATFRGPYFVDEGGGFDWVWQEFLVNGVRWRRKTIPEIPLIQPEKAAALPVEITFTKEYRYELRGTETVDGRDCWVVDFAPVVAVTEGKSLYQGTVWVDREIYARVRTRTVQLGLEGEVVSSEETQFFSPLGADGLPGPWSPESYFLPLRLVGQQIWSILSGTTVVEREILLSDVALNPEDFDASRQAALDSEATIVRDTDDGLKYLVIDEETGERVVKAELDTKRRFLVGGVFYDENQDFPIPLGGINWFWFDWRGTGTQANVFFAGPLVNVAITDPDFLGSKWDLGVDAFALALRGTDNLFRDGIEAVEEEVETSNPNLDLKLGRPLGNFGKVEFQYQLGYRSFGRVDATAEEFVLPSNHANHTLSLTTRYNRKGYRFRARGNYHLRGEWELWGLPGNLEYEPDDDAYTTWSVGVGKVWHLPKFLKFGAELEFLDGSNLDRFSKFDFGSFSDVRVRGYQTGKVRAEEALAAHLSYGWNLGNVFRAELLADAAWATDEVSGLDRELLAGAGVAGTFVGPWSTVVNVDLGVAVAGPDDGFTANIFFLKLFKNKD